MADTRDVGHSANSISHYEIDAREPRSEAVRDLSKEFVGRQNLDADVFDVFRIQRRRIARERVNQRLAAGTVGRSMQEYREVGVDESPTRFLAVDEGRRHLQSRLAVLDLSELV